LAEPAILSHDNTYGCLHRLYIDRVVKAIGYTVLAIAASVSLVFVNVLKPDNLGVTAFFSAWLLLPYAALALALMFLARERVWALAYVAVSALVAGGGLLFLTDIIFLHPDPQGGIGVLFTPIYQAIAIVVLLPTCRWLIGKAGGR
jgi:hypothetical protein